MHAPLKLSETMTGADGCTLEVAGELDLATATQFRTEVSKLLGTGCRHLVVDLSRTTFLDSSGLGALVWAAHRLRSAGGQLIATRPTEHVARTLRITGVEHLLALRED
ncbi:MAG TPA: STAS domain-containing protein [Solirubrobacteraceae bacterium]|jgi:anti-anti-sigma factor